MNNPLHELDSIHASQATKEKTLTYVTKHKRRFPTYWILVPIAVCLILLFIVPKQEVTSQPVAFVSLDINPSLELQLDQNYQVIKVITYNQEAKMIVEQINIENDSFQDAMMSLIDNQHYLQYIKDGILEISVFSQQEKMSNELEKQINTLLKQHLSEYQYHCSQVDEQTHHQASSHHTTAGKYSIIESILSYTTKYSFEQLNQMSIQELYSILNQYDSNAVPEGCHFKDNQENHHKHH